MGAPALLLDPLPDVIDGAERQVGEEGGHGHHPVFGGSQFLVFVSEVDHLPLAVGTATAHADPQHPLGHQPQRVPEGRHTAPVRGCFLPRRVLFG